MYYCFRTDRRGGRKSNLDSEQLLCHLNKMNRKAQIEVLNSLTIPTHYSSEARTRGKSVLGYSVKKEDVKIEYLQITLSEMVDIMNTASKDACLHYSPIVTNVVFVDSRLKELKVHLRKRTRGIVNTSNVKSYVNYFANGGKAKLPQSTRLSRFTEHHFSVVKYNHQCPECANQLLLRGSVILYDRKKTYKKEKVVEKRQGKILYIFLILLAKKLRYP